MADRGGRVVASALTGVAAGIAASFAMNVFQMAVLRVSGAGAGGDPATVKAAEKLTGRPLAPRDKPMADAAVHYTVGGVLGLIYGLMTEIWPASAAGFGLPFGAATSLVIDEAAVPALGLAEAPWRTPAATHAYGIASHLVFGGVLEGVRRLLRRGVHA